MMAAKSFAVLYTVDGVGDDEVAMVVRSWRHGPAILRIRLAVTALACPAQCRRIHHHHHVEHVTDPLQIYCCRC